MLTSVTLIITAWPRIATRGNNRRLGVGRLVTSLYTGPTASLEWPGSASAANTSAYQLNVRRTTTLLPTPRWSIERMPARRS